MIFVPRRDVFPESDVLGSGSAEAMQVDDQISAAGVGGIDCIIYKLAIVSAFTILALPLAPAEPEFFSDGKADDIALPLFGGDNNRFEDVFAHRVPLHAVE